PRLDIFYQRRYGSPEVNEQVGRFDIGNDAFEDVTVIFKITGTHQAHVIEVLRKDVGILINGAILDNVCFLLLQLHNMAEAAVEEKNLQVKRPTFHVAIKIL